MNETIVISTKSWQNELHYLLKKYRSKYPLFITSKGAINRFKIKDSFQGFEIYSNVPSHPTDLDCQIVIDYLFQKKFDCVVAIGGGSVMDVAKVVLACLETNIYDLKDLLDVSDFESNIASIFIPTTHGTGSESTKWGTIWQKSNNKKISISNDSLYPRVALLDGKLCVDLPLEISIISTLDALSHSFESIWNKNKNPTSTKHAINAISIILQFIDDLKLNQKDVNIRNNLLLASNEAGKAFSTTATAAAHSISYPLTLKYNIPHGIAASMPIIPLLKINKSYIKNEINQLLDTLNYHSLDQLIKSISSIPKGLIKFSLYEYGIEESMFDEIISSSFTKGRMENNIKDLNNADVNWILNEIM